LLRSTNGRSLFLAKLAYRSADNIIAISNFTKQELLKKVIIQNIEVISPGIDLDKFHRKHKDSSEKFILSIGALKPRKGYHISIPAFALAKKQIPNLKYKIVGSQEDIYYFSKLKKLALKYRVEKDLEFLSGISDKELSDLYSRASLFILTSVNLDHHFEGFGLVFLEAAAAGLPVIGTLGNGIEDAVKDGYNGILVPQGDVKKVADAMVEIINNKVKWQEMSKASYNWTKEHDRSNVVERYLEVYERI